MTLKQIKLSSFLALALILTISLTVSMQLSQVNAQTSPTVTINNGATYTNSTTVTLTLTSTNASQMSFSNDNASWSSWEAYATTKNWTIPNTEGAETVYVQFRDSSNQTSFASTSIILDLTPPDVVPYWDYYSSDLKTVVLDASASTDNYGIQTGTWNFGDGNVTSSPSASLIHTYSSIGNYTVTLTLTDYAGNSASQSFMVTIPDISTIPTATPAPTNQPTTNPTTTGQPTAPPTATTASTLDPLTTIVLVGAIGIIIVVVIAIIFVLRRKPKPSAQAEQQAPAQQPSSPPPGPSESNFNI